MNAYRENAKITGKKLPRLRARIRGMFRRCIIPAVILGTANAMLLAVTWTYSSLNEDSQHRINLMTDRHYYEWKLALNLMTDRHYYEWKLALNHRQSILDDKEKKIGSW